MPRARTIWGSLLAALPLSDATAGTTTDSLLVTATVASSCQINSVATLAFGTYDPLIIHSDRTGTDLSANGLLTLSCTRSSLAVITLGQGAHPAPGSTDAVPLRQMKSGDLVLAYELFQDASHAIRWGNGPDDAVQLTGSGGVDPVALHGVIRKGQNVPAGSYTDIVIVTVTF